MENKYFDAIKIIKKTRDNLEKVIINAKEKSFENKRAHISIENLLSEFEIVMDTIEYYSKPSKEGHLIENSDGEFEIKYINGGSNCPLYCGDDIEILINADGWKAGRVESTRKNNVGYYFYNEESEKHALYNGMKVRLRINDLVP